MKLHKTKLPVYMRIVGDKYVRNEFKLFKNVSDENQLANFYIEWNTYLNYLLKQNNKFGKDMTEDERNNLSNEQREKISQLREETIVATILESKTRDDNDYRI